MKPKTIFRTAAVATEQVVHAGRCKVYAIVPETAVTETVTLRNAAAGGGSNVVYAGTGAKDFQGVLFDTGLTVQLSVGTERYGIVYEAL